MGNNEIDEDVMPVFLINGFLEAGKTSRQREKHS